MLTFLTMAMNSNAQPSPSNVLEFLQICGRLREVKRTGWVKKNVKGPESVSDHSWRMALISFLAPKTVDRDRVIRMAIVHDLGEAIVGDITPYCGVSPSEKAKRELLAYENIAETLQGSVGREILELHKEYEAGVTPEAKFIKNVDKFEMLCTALEYETAQEINLEEFFKSTEGVFSDSDVASWVAELRSRRKILMDSKEPAAKIN
mmetsp:Transcript_36932/g.59753  ORF Transcript_36932/g.59753 Transcript_36932/m.59753 type:complete len:206 (-) Transcript_36932:442-1059(-)